MLVGWIVWGVCIVGRVQCRVYMYVLCGACAVWDVYSVGCVRCGACTVWGVYSVGRVQCGACTVWGVYSVRRVQCEVCTVWGMCSVGRVQCMVQQRQSLLLVSLPSPLVMSVVHNQAQHYES